MRETHNHVFVKRKDVKGQPGRRSGAQPHPVGVKSRQITSTKFQTQRISTVSPGISMTYAKLMALLMALGVWQDLTPSSAKCPGKSHRGIRFTSDGINARALREGAKDKT